MNFLIFSAVILTGCHTTARWFDSDSSLKNTPGDIRLDESAVSELAPKIKSLQIQYGKLPPKSRLYSSAHNLHCYQDGALQNCYVRLVLADAPYLSQPLALSRELTQTVLTTIKQSRRDLREERQIFATLLCDQMADTLPPFGASAMFCRVMNSRRVNEVVIMDQQAEQLTQLMSQSIFDPQKKLPQFDLECQLDQGRECRIAPKVEPLAKKTDRWTAISGGLAAKILSSFSQSFLQSWAITQGENQRDIPELKKLNGVLTCATLGRAIKSLYRCSILF